MAAWRRPSLCLPTSRHRWHLSMVAMGGVGIAHCVVAAGLPTGPVRMPIIGSKVPAMTSLSDRPSPSSAPCWGGSGSRGFYLLTALALIAISLWGFRHFYFHGLAYPGRPLTPGIRSLVVVHAVAMTAWLGLLFTQTLLIARHRTALHRQLGQLGAALAATIVTLGLGLALASTQLNPPDLKIWGLTPQQFMAVPIFTILLFAFGVAMGLAERGRPALHRTWMLLASLAAIPAAVSRIDGISHLYDKTWLAPLFGPFLGALVLALALLALRSLLQRGLDRPLAWGCAGLVLTSLAIMRFASTPLWAGLAGWLLS